ncbi:hypothetical protein WJX81_003111 [Elliptochloris bilobata]|uniref:Protein-S-isoprenylcysteine O-methyltransferase n=1 Tax=Elliptochloris bilobata TaxID=381761 RepID=A0AAW1RDP8_9CHLO
MMNCLSCFMASLAFFHISEFLLAWVYMRQDWSRKSLLLSRPYSAAMACAVAEYLLEGRLLPGLKRKGQGVACLGLAVVVCGEAVRKTAMVTAKGNFTHALQFQRREGHVLVTHGIYRYMRHPGYAGWLLWVVGTQALLVNPFCLLAFPIVAWRFFRTRVEVEEQQLRSFFGPAYLAYAQRVPSGLPFIP